MHITLASYTYNDANLLNGLLGALDSWTRRPDDILIVDDGSSTPFHPPALDIPIRVIRRDQNKGITFTKSQGISAAQGDVTLSLDSDTRLSPEWLERCLPHLETPGVGLVSGELYYSSGDDTVSRFMRAFGDNYNIGRSGEVEFISGNAWLFRSAVWREVGGFGAHDAPIGEDHAFCRNLQAAGYILFCEPSATARQQRRLSRTAMAQRFWSWFRPGYLGKLPTEESVFYALAQIFLPPLVQRVETALNAREPAFVYLELLYFFHILFDLLRAGEEQGRYTTAPRGALWDWLFGPDAALSAHPKLCALLQQDLTHMGYTAPADASPNREELGGLFSSLGILKQGGVLTWLDREGVSLLLREEHTGGYDFSFYDAADGKKG